MSYDYKQKETILREVGDDLTRGDYQEVRRIYTRLEMRIEDEIPDFDMGILHMVEDAYDKACEAGRGLAERFVITAAKNREEEEV